MNMSMLRRTTTLLALGLSLAGCIVYDPAPPYPAYYGSSYAYPPAYGSLNLGFNFGGHDGWRDRGWHEGGWHHWR